MELVGVGVGSTPGVGTVFRLETASGLMGERTTARTPEEEAGVLSEAILTTATSLRSESGTGDSTAAEIINALLIILEDQELQDLAKPHLEAGFDAPTALFKALDDVAQMMGDDADFVSRVGDLRGIATRISGAVRGIAPETRIPAEGEWVVVADDLTPLETSQFGSSVVGVVTEFGGPTSHTAIICRALGIPAVVSAAGALTLERGSRVLVDPVGNRVVTGAEISAATAALRFIPGSDTPLITIRANIGSVEDARVATASGARGVGLFRTEVLYLSHTREPSVAAQATLYGEVLRAAPPGTIIIRTIDAGSDKPVPFLAHPAEENPALGVRGFRLRATHRDFQKAQLDAIGIAVETTGRSVGVMAPMVATYEEVEDFAEMCHQAGLRRVGIMVETPAIIPMLGDLATLISFLSIGTNDLSQYLFAADRLHPQLGALNDPWQPGLLRTVKVVADAAAALGVPLGVCGESAAHPLLAIVFAGLGVDSLSIAPSAIAEVSEALRSVTRQQAALAATEALKATSAAAAREVVREMFAHSAMTIT